MKIKKETNLKTIKKLYLSAFPKVERMPIWMMKILTKPETSRIYSAYDNGKFVGFAYCVFYRDLMYLQFLAIDSTIRGKGYGSKLLQGVCKEFAGYRIILCAEEAEPKYDNYKERKRRLNFYNKNDFKISGLKLNEFGVQYDILSYKGKKFNKAEYFLLMRNYCGATLFDFFYWKNAF